VPREAPVAYEAEDVPGDEPTGQAEREFALWADGAGPAGASGVSAALEAAAKFRRPLEGVDAAGAAGADVQHAAATDAVPLLHVEDDGTENRALWPAYTQPHQSPANRPGTEAGTAPFAVI
jgi:hypothetical protein